MRRKDREVNDINEILEIIEGCDHVNLGLCADSTPYIVPLNFGYTYAGGVLTLYFHGALEGKKLDLIRQNPNACFSMSRARRYVPAGTACGSTMEYESVMGDGYVTIIEDTAQKRAGLDALMRHCEPGKAHEFTDEAVRGVCVFKLTASGFSAKRLKKQA